MAPGSEMKARSGEKEGLVTHPKGLSDVSATISSRSQPRMRYRLITITVLCQLGCGRPEWTRYECSHGSVAKTTKALFLQKYNNQNPLETKITNSRYNETLRLARENLNSIEWARGNIE